MGFEWKPIAHLDVVAARMPRDAIAPPPASVSVSRNLTGVSDRSRNRSSGRAWIKHPKDAKKAGRITRPALVPPKVSSCYLSMNWQLGHFWNARAS